MFRGWKLRRAWRRAQLGVALIEAALRDLPRQERRAVLRDLVEQRPMPLAVMAHVSARLAPPCRRCAR